MTRLLLTSLLLGLTGCLELSDPVTLGTLCVPAQTSCPTQVDLDRGTSLGRNAIDYEVTNRSTSVARVSLRARATQQTTEPDAGVNPTVGPEPQDLTEQRVEIAPGASVQGRFVARDLGREPLLTLISACESDCDVTVRYVLINEPNECVVTEECSGGWLCDATYGECVECLSNDDCPESQACTLGRCPPARTSDGCNHTPEAPPLGTLLWTALLLLGLGRRHHKAAALAVSIALVLAAPAAHAEDQEMSTSFSLGVGPRLWTGDIGANTERGIGVSVAQQLRWSWFGVGAKLHTSFFLTTPNTLPLSRELLTYAVELGPRAYIELPEEFTLSFGAGYERMGLASNSLVELTGTQISYHGVVGEVSVSWHYEALEAQLGFGYHHLFGLPGGMLMLNVMLGVRGG